MSSHVLDDVVGRVLPCLRLDRGSPERERTSQEERGGHEENAHQNIGRDQPPLEKVEPARGGGQESEDDPRNERGDAGWTGVEAFDASSISCFISRCMAERFDSRNRTKRSMSRR